MDGSVVVALPIDEWTAPHEQNEFIGGGLTFWDGPKTSTVSSSSSSTNDSDGKPSVDSKMTNEVHYDTRSGDMAFIDRYVFTFSSTNLCRFTRSVLSTMEFRTKVMGMIKSLLTIHFLAHQLAYFNDRYVHQGCLASSRSHYERY